MQLVLYYVSRNPEVQETIRNELYNVLGKDHTGPITAAQLNGLKYLRATIREAQR